MMVVVGLMDKAKHNVRNIESLEKGIGKQSKSTHGCFLCFMLNWHYDFSIDIDGKCLAVKVKDLWTLFN